jgi:hypothetical protein
MIQSAVNPDDRWLFRASGISTLVLGLAYVGTVVLYLYVGKLPSGGEAWLKYLDGKQAVWWWILGLSVLTDLLFIPLALALYAALGAVNKGAAAIVAALIGLFVALDLTGTWSHYASLISLSGGYAAATSAAQRAQDVAAANYGAAFLGSRLEAFYSFGLLSSAILLVSLIMLKGDFGKAAAYAGIAGGIFGIVSITGWNLPVLLNALLVAIWIFLVSYRLYFRPAAQASTLQPAPPSTAEPAIAAEVSS